MSLKRTATSQLWSMLAITFLSIYAYSRLSWGNLINNYVWGIILVLSILILAAVNMNRGFKIQIDIPFICCISMIFVYYLWDNQDIAHYGITISSYFIFNFVLFLLIRNSSSWHPIAVKIMILQGVFYTTWTYICILVPEIYYSFVFPMMQDMGFISDIKAGFTAFYGANGLYMSLGLCAYTGYFLFNGKKKKTNKKAIIGLIILVVGMLLSGKRGQALALCISFYCMYYFYNSNKKLGRLFKLATITLLGFVLLYLASFFIPEVTTIIDRFQEQADKDDISTGRFYMWANAWGLFIQEPLWGRGWRWFRFSNFTIEDYDVHNVFLQWFVELGIVGAMPFFVFVALNSIKVIKLMIFCRTKSHALSNREISYISIALLYQIFFLIMCATGTAFYQFECLFPYILCVCIVHYYSKGRIKNRQLREI